MLQPTPVAESPGLPYYTMYACKQMLISLDVVIMGDVVLRG